MTNPFVALGLTLTIADPMDPFTNTNWRDVVSISKCGRVPECASESFYLFIYLFIYLFYRFYLIYLFLGYDILYFFKSFYRF